MRRLKGAPDAAVAVSSVCTWYGVLMLPAYVCSKAVVYLVRVFYPPFRYFNRQFQTSKLYVR